MGIPMEVNEYEAASDMMMNQYGEEIMCAGWNPALGLIGHPQLLEPTGRDDAMPADLVTADVELFLRQMYAYQN
ncbi:MAG: hypothetical protein WCF51_04670 [Nitrosomonadaceae bacterium]|jgi:hypothetical protein